MHSRTAVFVALILAIVLSQYVTLSVILRPHWFPYFRANAEAKTITGHRFQLELATEFHLPGRQLRERQLERRTSNKQLPADDRPLPPGGKGRSIGLNKATARRLRVVRQLPHEDIPCPADMTEYECYHTFMAAWTRLLKIEKRLHHRD